MELGGDVRCSTCRNECTALLLTLIMGAGIIVQILDDTSTECGDGGLF